MNPSAPDSDATSYVSAVLALYLGLPETPLRTSAQDPRYARQFYNRGVPLARRRVGFSAGFSAPITPAG